MTTSGGVPRDAPTGHKEKLWRNRLAAWEDELRTDRHGMAHIAPRCIAILKSEIAEFWGDTLFGGLSEKSGGSGQGDA